MEGTPALSEAVDSSFLKEIPMGFHVSSTDGAQGLLIFPEP